MNGARSKTPLACPFCGDELEFTGDRTQWRHPGSLSLQAGCILRGRRIGEDELDLWNKRAVPEQAIF